MSDPRRKRPRITTSFQPEEPMMSPLSVPGAGYGRPAANTSASSGSPEGVRATPTPETQALYNAMRDLQDQEHLQPPPSPARSSTMSRSPSGTSTSSLNIGMGGVAIQDSPSPGRRQTEKGRKGPLSPSAKAAAAFYRKIGACTSCHSRKVKCHDHHDFSLFEQAYKRRRKQNSPMQATRLPNYQFSPRSNFAQVNFDDLPTSAPAVGSGGPAAVPSPVPVLLLGVGAGQGPREIAPSYDLTVEVDDMLSEGNMGYMGLLSPLPPSSPMPSIPQTPAVAPMPAIPRAGPARSFSLAAQGLLSPVTIPAARSQASTADDVSTTASPESTILVPIGRLADEGNNIWECQGESSTYSGSRQSIASLSEASTTPSSCHERSSSLRDLLRHYELQHGPFRPFKQPPFMFKCYRCAYISEEKTALCPNSPCQRVREMARWETWYYGCLERAGSLATERFVSVPAGEGTPSFDWSAGTSFTSFNLGFQFPGGGSNAYLQPPSHRGGYRSGGRGRRRRKMDDELAPDAPEEDEDIIEAPRSHKLRCPLRRLPLGRLGLTTADGACGWRQPSGPSSSSSFSPSTPLSESACPLATAARLLLLPLLLVVFLLLVMALQWSVAVATPHAIAGCGPSAIGGGGGGGGVRSIGGGASQCTLRAHHLLIAWLLWATAGVLGTWLLGAVGVGVNRLGRLRLDEDDTVAASALVAVGV